MTIELAEPKRVEESSERTLIWFAQGAPLRAD
jgi:hypothetical protein